MFRNENELINSLFHKLNGKTNKPKPLTEDELAKIETYRDGNGLIDLTNVTSINELKKIIELVDRKNHLEEISYRDTDSIQALAGDLVTELLPLLGVNKASLKIKTSSGKASVEVEQGKEPRVTYDLSDKCDEGTTLTYSVTPSSEVNDNKDVQKEANLGATCNLYDCGTCLDFKECFNEVSDKMNRCDVSRDANELPSDKFVKSAEECILESSVADERVVRLVPVGGTYNPLFENAVAYICENEHFVDCGVYTDADVAPEKIDVYVLLPNTFGKILGAAADIYADILDEGQAQVYVIDTETFELTEITEPFELYNYTMTEAQEDLIGY